MTKKELKEFVLKNPADIYKVKFISPYSNYKQTLAVHFTRAYDTLFESAVNVVRFYMNEDDLREYLNKYYSPETAEGIFERYSKNIIGDYWYRVDYEECYPFLPKEIISVETMDEHDFIVEYAEHWVVPICN